MPLVLSALIAHLDVPLAAHPIAALAGGGVSLDLDRSFLIQAIAFFVIILVLKPLLFEPVLRIFEEREKRTDGARSEAREMQEEAGGLLRKYERELERVGRVAAEERDRIRAETGKQEAEILEEARVIATKISEEGRKKIDDEVNRIRFDLGKRSAELSRDITRRVLGREAS